MTTSPITSLLSRDAQQTVGGVLQNSLADLIDLSLLAKQAHWKFWDTTSASPHLHLDELVTLARSATDDVAERAAATGDAGRNQEPEAPGRSPRSPGGGIGRRKVAALLCRVGCRAPTP